MTIHSITEHEEITNVTKNIWDNFIIIVGFFAGMISAYGFISTIA